MSLPYLQPYLGLSNGLNTLHAAGGPGGGAAGGWVELGRTTLGGTADSITVSSLADKRYYMVLYHILDSGQANNKIRLGYSSVDTGSNYSFRNSANGGAETTSLNSPDINITNDQTYDDKFGYYYIANYSSKEKLLQGWSTERGANSGATNVPPRKEWVAKWTNTSNPLDTVNQFNSATGDFATNSEIVVLGYDPLDTHSNNFWEELAAVDLSGGDASSLSTGTITAKNYLWIQFLVEVDTLNADCFIRFNNHSGTNYAWRRSIDGGGDTTVTSRNSIDPEGSLQTSQPMFVNMFVINKDGYEKLFIGNTIRQNTAGAANAPTKREWVGKWASIGGQITDVSITAQTGNFKSKTIMRVWGAD